MTASRAFLFRITDGRSIWVDELLTTFGGAFIDFDFVWVAVEFGPDGDHTGVALVDRKTQKVARLFVGPDYGVWEDEEGVGVDIAYWKPRGDRLYCAGHCLDVRWTAPLPRDWPAYICKVAGMFDPLDALHLGFTYEDQYPSTLDWDELHEASDKTTQCGHCLAMYNGKEGPCPEC